MSMLSKDTFKKVKRHQIGETYAKQIFYKGLYLDYIEPLQSNNKKTKKPKKKWINYLNSYFSKEYIKMAKQNINRCSTSLVIKEMQIKTTS